MKKLKKNYALKTHLTNAYKNVNINQIIKIIKKTPINILVNCLNEIEDSKINIFVLVCASQTKIKDLLYLLNFERSDEILENTSNSELKIILKGLWPDQIFQLLTDHKDYAKKIVLNLDSDTRQEINKISKYDDDEVGYIMNPEFLTLSKDWTITRCLNFIKKESINVEHITSLYIVDEENKLYGKVKLHDLFFASNYRKKVFEICDTNPISLTDKSSVDEVIQIFEKYNIDSIPVCNSKKNIKGIIQSQDVLNVIQGEFTYDIYNMYGMSEISTPYLVTPILKIVKSRILWLIILMISATITSFIIDQFQNLGEQLTAGLSTIFLIPLIPVLTGTSGNAGSQSSASIIRALSVGDITNKEYSKAILKEFYVGLIIGLILAVVNFARLAIYNAIFYHQTIDGLNISDLELYEKRMIISASTSLSLFVAIVLSKLLGASLPILALKLKIDPTVMSAPILATVLDVTTTTLLFGIGLGITILIF